jgi:hypothetical protein
MQGVPIDTLIAGIRNSDQFHDQMFFILVDEYEKLEDYQQIALNTLIKQSGEHYCFKIAVRELGMRTHETLSPNEHLISPADYSLIDVDAELDGERFQRFARLVCNQRLARLSPGDDRLLRDVEDLFPGYSESEEEYSMRTLASSRNCRRWIQMLPRNSSTGTRWRCTSCGSGLGGTVGTCLKWPVTVSPKVKSGGIAWGTISMRVCSRYGGESAALGSTIAAGVLSLSWPLETFDICSSWLTGRWWPTCRTEDR